MTGTQRLRIAMIGQRGVPATFGGVERHVEELGARMVERGHDVTVFCRSGYAETTATTHRGMRLITLPAMASKHFEAISHSAYSSMHTVGAGFDIVHYHAVGPGLTAPVPRCFSRAKVLLTVHGLDGERQKWGAVATQMLRLAAWMSARVPDRTVVVAQALVEHYRNTYGRDVHWITNGVTPAVPAPAGAALERLGLTPNRYVLFVGRLVPEKAPDLLLKAFAELPTHDYKIVLAGGSSYTGGLQETLHDLAGNDPRVVMPGYVFGDDLRELYSNAAAFVLPSYLEGLPLTLLEALSYRRPVVLSDIAPHREVVGADAAGHRLFTAGDQAGLARALREVLHGLPQEQAAAQTRAPEILRRYDWDAVADATLGLYAETLGLATAEVVGRGVDRVIALPVDARPQRATIDSGAQV